MAESERGDSEVLDSLAIRAREAASFSDLALCAFSGVAVAVKITMRATHNEPAERRAEKPLCGSLCDLCASVVNACIDNFTTETPRTTEFAQRNSCIVSLTLLLLSHTV